MPKPPKLDASTKNTKITPEQVDEVAEGKCMTVRELAEDLKYSVGWIAQRVREGRIAAVKPLGGRWRIPMSEVRRIKEAGLSPPPKKSEPEPEESSAITVDSHHMERMKGPEKESKKRGLLDLLLEAERQ